MNNNKPIHSFNRNQVFEDITQFLIDYGKANGATDEWIDKCLKALDEHLDMLYGVPMVKILRKPR